MIQSFQRYTLSILRIIASFTFCLHGLVKVFGMFGGLGGHGASAPPWSLFWVAGVLEAGGGVLLLLGIFTRSVAFILCGEMAVAYFTQHFPQGFWPVSNGGELAVLYCFLFLYLFTAGPGHWSLDSLIWKKGT
ncbi:MAG: DoxX family protein [Bryobacteraceae bacterium]